MTEENNDDSVIQITPGLRVLTVNEQKDGGCTIEFDADPEWIEKFIKDNNLDEWDQTFFESWFNEALQQGLDILEQLEKDNKE